MKYKINEDAPLYIVHLIFLVCVRGGRGYQNVLFPEFDGINILKVVNSFNLWNNDRNSSRN